MEVVELKDGDDTLSGAAVHALMGEAQDSASVRALLDALGPCDSHPVAVSQKFIRRFSKPRRIVIPREASRGSQRCFLRGFNAHPLFAGHLPSQLGSASLQARDLDDGLMKCVRGVSVGETRCASQQKTRVRASNHGLHLQA